MATKDNKPSVKGQGGMKGQTPQPPIKGGNSQGTPNGSNTYMKGKPTTPRGGSASTANKKPTP